MLELAGEAEERGAGQAGGGPVCGVEPEQPRVGGEGACRSPSSRHGPREQLNQDAERPARLWGV